MVTWVSLLRGINVGGARKIKMADLKSTFERAGFVNVRTFIQSGNVVFESETPDRDLIRQTVEASLQELVKVQTTCILRTGTEMASLAAKPHFPVGFEAQRAIVRFLERSPGDLDFNDLREFCKAGETCVVVGEEAFIHYPVGQAASKLSGSILERWLGVESTARNWRTVTTLAEMAAR